METATSRQLEYRPSSKTAVRVVVRLSSATSNEPRRGVPSSIPASQAYYWSAEWQADEREALAELAAGEGQEFESMDDAIRALFND